MRILAINPGSTSTKISVYEDQKEIFSKNLSHEAATLSGYQTIFAQYPFRKQVILDSLKEASIDIHSLNVVVGRGGLLKPIPSGAYRVNERMIEELKQAARGEHASNLGAALALEIAREAGFEIPALIIDPVVVDEMAPMARVSGHPLFPRQSIFHALNQKAVARRFAREKGKKPSDLNLIVAHLGGGVSVGVHEKGKVIDVNNALDGDGPFSPERSGSMPIGAVIKACFSGKYSRAEMITMLKGKGGLVAFFGTNNALEIEKLALSHDPQARFVLEAMAYQIAKEIGAGAAVLKGKVDGIILTGGLAHSEAIATWIRERVSFIAPVVLYPGEGEMESLAQGAWEALKGELEVKEYA